VASFSKVARHLYRKGSIGPLRTPLFAALLGLALCVASPVAIAQQVQDAPGEEVVANLAAGRVIIAVVKDAILIVTLENPIEPQTRVPTPVEINGRRAGIILGAVEWISPSSQVEFARLDRDLPHIHSQTAIQAPHLQETAPDTEAKDIEDVGRALAERLNQIAKNVHSQIHMAENEPVVELILADYMDRYGAEVWQLTYSFKQAMERENYFDTKIPAPHYLQIWPPEKGQPHTLMEFHYPPEVASPTLLDLLRQRNPALEKICSSDPKTREVANLFLAGESNKILAVDATQFLRAALTTIASPESRETMAAIGIETGFDWILKPPAEPKRPGEEKERPDDAPSLVRPHPSN
jgi:hypothetical protein